MERIFPLSLRTKAGMHLARALLPLGRFWQGLWCVAPMAQGLASFSLLLFVLVQEVSPWCLLPPQGLESLSSARAVGIQQAAGCRQAQEPLCRGVGCQLSPGTWVTPGSPHLGLAE